VELFEQERNVRDTDVVGPTCELLHKCVLVLSRWEMRCFRGRGSTDMACVWSPDCLL
jgi:hypothetical protein